MGNSSRNRVKVILNPKAGRGRGARWRDPIGRAFSDAGITFDVEETEGPGHARSLARKSRLEEFSVIVIVGGDGTVSEVVQGLAEVAGPESPLGPLVALPAGNANDFAAMSGSPGDPETAARAILAGRVMDIDLGLVKTAEPGEVAGRIFHNSLGLGLEAQVNLEVAGIRWLRGPALYLLGALRALRRCRTSRISLRWESGDGACSELEQDCLLVTAGNGPRVGGAFFLTPDAELDDGLLDLCVVGPMSLWRIARLLPKALRRRQIRDPGVRIVRCRRFDLESEIGLPLHVDGEVLATGARRLKVDTLPLRLRLVC